MELTERELIGLYRRFDADCGLAADMMRSAREYESELFIPTVQARETLRNRLQGLAGRASSLPSPGPVYELLREHFMEFLVGQVSLLESNCADPLTFIVDLTRFVDFTTRKDSRFAEERSTILLRRLRQATDMWAAIRELLPTTLAGNVVRLADACDMLGTVCSMKTASAASDFAGLPDRRLADVIDALQVAARQAREWAAEAALSAKNRDTEGEAGRPTVERYRQILAEERGVDLDELVRWHEDEVNKTRTELLHIASRLQLGAEAVPTTIGGVVDVLNRHAGPCDTAEEMFSRCREYLARARASLRGYVNLPEEICRVVPMEEYGREQNPWGGYRGGDPRRRPLLGEMVLNDGNLQAITDGWIKINAVHEAYPGHHVQFVRTTADPLPETVKLGARSVPITEGTCLRTERVFEFVFPEDQFFPLMVAYRRHHTSVRIKVDLYLFYYQRPVEDAVQLYIDELGFSPRSARGQVKAQELWPGYFTCYYYGLKRILELEAQLGYDDRSFTEMLFSVGRVSLRSFEGFLQLSEADRKRFLTQFPSLLSY